MSLSFISEYFSDDHDRMDEIWTRFNQSTCPQQRLSLFNQFSSQLKQHIQWEEELLFPIFDVKMNFFDSGPTFVMREEHRKIIDLLTLIENKLLEDENGYVEQQQLSSLLHQHNMKEEHVLYPALDQLLDNEELEALSAQIGDSAHPLNVREGVS